MLDIALSSLDIGSDSRNELHKIAGNASKGKQSIALRGWLSTIKGGEKRTKNMERAMYSRCETFENRLLPRIW